jgi:hypothetical protein
MRKTITDNLIACVDHFSAQQCPQRAPPSMSRQATFRLPSSSTYMHTPLWRIAHKQDVGHLCTARDVLYAGEPAV